jgi:hypothetical protein
MLISTMNDLLVVDEVLGEICAYGTAVKVSRAI